MKLIEFPQQMMVLAKDQPQYFPMPAHVDSEGTVTCCWSLTWRERFRLLLRGKLWHQVMTFNRPLQPQMLHIDKPPLS